MRIAVEGCSHGELHKIYSTLQYIEEKHSITIDLLICCGDFESIRNNTDLSSLNCPPKYKILGDFHHYYEGKAIAPILTIFVGGNHEASNYLFDNYHGGWVCPNIYFLGYSGVINIGGLVIAGYSGIYKAYDYRSGYFETLPLNDSDIRSICHTREYEIEKLKLYSKNVDIMISHDWPSNATKFGNVSELLSKKPDWKQEIEHGELGSKAGEDLMNKMKPIYWFSGHMHVKYAAKIKFDDDSVTKFLALDKCLVNRDFLQILEIESPTNDYRLFHDPEWLTILKAMDSQYSDEKRMKVRPPTDEEYLAAKKFILLEDLNLEITAETIQSMLKLRPKKLKQTQSEEIVLE